MRLTAVLLALVVCSSVALLGAASREDGRTGWIVIYQAPWELHAITKDRRIISVKSSDPEPPLGGNAIAVVPEQRLLIIDVDGVNIYRLSRTKQDGRVSHLIATPVSRLHDLGLEGVSRDGRLLVVTSKHDLEDRLLALPMMGRPQDVRKLPVSGRVTILRAPASKAKDRGSLLALLKHPFVADDPSDLLVLDITAGPTSELARLPSVLDAAWCQASGKLVAVLSPKSARKLNLKSNLVEWDFEKGRVKALDRGMSFTPPIVDGGDYVVSGLASSDGSDTHELAVISRAHARGTLAHRAARRILKVPGDPSNLYVTSDGRCLFLLAWPKPNAHSISRWARLISYDMKTGKSNELAHESNHYVVIDDEEKAEVP